MKSRYSNRSGWFQGSKSRTMLKFQSLTRMMLFRYRVDVSMHGASNRLKMNKEGDETQEKDIVYTEYGFKSYTILGKTIETHYSGKLLKLDATQHT